MLKLLNADGNSTSTGTSPIEAAATAMTAPPAAPEVTPQPSASAPEVKPDPKVAAKFAALAKSERTLTAREKALADREAQIAAREKLAMDPRELAKKDPTKAAEMIGLSYEEWTRHMLSQAKPADPTQTKLTALEQKLQDMERAAKEREEQESAEQRKLEQQEQMQSVTDYVEENAEKYELIQRTKYQGVVLEVIGKYAAANEGKLLSFQEACDLTEKYLEEQVEATLSWKKVQAKIGAKTAAPPAQPKTSTSAEESVPTKTDSTITSDFSAATRLLTKKPAPSQNDEFAAAASLLKFSKGK
jgi:hypothetical protein